VQVICARGPLYANLSILGETEVFNGTYNEFVGTFGLINDEFFIQFVNFVAVLHEFFQVFNINLDRI
jgi:hypothetical protein